MGLESLSLLGSYGDSDDEESKTTAAAAGPTQTGATAAQPLRGGPTKTVPSAKGGAAGAGGSKSSTAPPPAAAAGPDGKHAAMCDCDDCGALLVRYVAKALQTKGIRFKCKSCGELLARKADASVHFMSAHAPDLQAFKKQKMPRLFEAAKPKKSGMSFSLKDVLGKRPADSDDSFGGWAKKEKPEPPPCEQPGYQEMVCEPVIAPPPWTLQPSPLLKEGSDTDKQVDVAVRQAQLRRFSKRNVLEVSATVVRCKLCYKTQASVSETHAHIAKEHQPDFQKEMELWNRFLLTSARRQPPFGWVCKICQIFFPTDQDVWRHLGKEVYMREEERHLSLWHEKEDRWGHQEDEECCGNGINVAGMSYEHVQQYNEEFSKMVGKEEGEAAAGNADKQGESSDSNGDDSSDDNAAKGPQFIQEF